MQIRSRNVKLGEEGKIGLPPVPLEDRYISAWVALHNEIVSIESIEDNKAFDFSGAREYDRITGYNTGSMLVVPMTDDKGEVIGVMQLINALSEDGEVVPFDKEKEPLILAAASQAAISITNIRYSEQISRLLDSLVMSLSSAIDERSPYTANHTRNMVRLGERFLDWLEETGNKKAMTPEHRRAFIMSIWLHDIGKLAIPLEIMDKSTRLGDKFEDIENRFRVMDLLDTVACLKHEITEEEFRVRREDRKKVLDLICSVNTGRPLNDEERSFIEDLSHRIFTDENGEEQHWITEDEYRSLMIPRGTLTSDERNRMESHVVITGHILENVSFPKEYKDVPLWAGAHHEFLDGKGYPLGVSDGEIPFETRLLTILDIYEALTAKDRPYKRPMSPERAFGILEEMSVEGKIDGDILGEFRESRAWEEKEG
jgi:HD-GYP domain-containing protein (c-di-GMP phosphodiesterase class II)